MVEVEKYRLPAQIIDKWSGSDCRTVARWGRWRWGGEWVAGSLMLRGILRMWTDATRYALTNEKVGKQVSEHRVKVKRAKTEEVLQLLAEHGAARAWRTSRQLGRTRIGATQKMLLGS